MKAAGREFVIEWAPAHEGRDKVEAGEMSQRHWFSNQLADDYAKKGARLDRWDKTKSAIEWAWQMQRLRA